MPVSSVFPYVFLKDEPFHKFILNGVLSHDPKSIALINSDTGEKVTFGQFYDYVAAVSKGFRELGLRKGEVVLLCLSNCPEYAIIALSIMKAGGIVSGIHTMSTVEELKTRLHTTECRYIFTTSEQTEKVLTALENGSTKVEKVFLLDKKLSPREHLSPMICDWKTLAKDQKDQETEDDNDEIEILTKTDVALLPFSSGTTGLPKGVMLTHYNLTAMMQIMSERAFFLQPSAGDHLIGVQPLFHVFGFMMLCQCLRDGCTTVTMSKFVPEKFYGLIEKYKVPMIHSVPPVMICLAKDPAVDKYDISSLMACNIGSAPLGEALTAAVFDRHPSVKYVCQGYGMTEGSLMSHLMPPTPRNELRYGSCGLLAQNLEAKVIDTENGIELGPNKLGEICIRGVTVMKGYWKAPSATAETIDQEGWLHTGDIGYYDEDEYFYIVDRKKELIKVNAFQVAPAELEDILLKHTAVKGAAVVGIPDERYGEIPKAFVALKHAGQVTEKTLVEYVNEKVAPYKHLKGGVEFVDEIPRSPSGKILRRLLREMAKRDNANKGVISKL